MEPESSLPQSQVPTICPYSQPDQSSLCPHPTSWRSILMFWSHLHLDLPSGLFPSGLTTKTLHAPLLSPTRTTWLADLILPDLITRIIFGEKYRVLSPSLCGLLHCPLVTSSLVGTNTRTILRTLLAITLSYVPRRILRKQLQDGGEKISHLRLIAQRATSS